MGWEAPESFKTCSHVKTQANLYFGIYQDLISKCAGNIESLDPNVPGVARDVIPKMATYLWKLRDRITKMDNCTWWKCTGPVLDRTVEPAVNTTKHGGCFDETDVEAKSKTTECLLLPPHAGLIETSGIMPNVNFTDMVKKQAFNFKNGSYTS